MVNDDSSAWVADEREYHERTAREYDDGCALDRIYSKVTNHKRVNDLKRIIETFKSPRILEVGCGTGFTLIPLLKQVNDASFYASDISSEMIKITRAKIIQENTNTNSTLQLDIADAMNLPFGDSSFQVIYLIHTLHHLPDLPAALAECNRVLAKGGVLYINDPVNSKFLTRIGQWVLRRKNTRDNLSPHERSFSLPQLSKECRRLFHVERTKVSNAFATTFGKSSNSKVVAAAIFTEKILARIPLINRIGLGVTLQCRKI